MRKFRKNPYAENLRKNGCGVRVTRGDGDSMEIVQEYFVSPKQIVEESIVCEQNIREILESERA
jgi:hypothetical protein